MNDEIMFHFSHCLIAMGLAIKFFWVFLPAVAPCIHILHDLSPCGMVAGNSYTTMSSHVLCYLLPSCQAFLAVLVTMYLMIVAMKWIVVGCLLCLNLEVPMVKRMAIVCNKFTLLHDSSECLSSRESWGLIPFNLRINNSYIEGTTLEINSLHWWGRKHCLHQNHVLHQFFVWPFHQFID
jgi:hypothetical protein